MKHPITSLEEVEAAGRKWQPRVRLQDWDITYVVKRLEDGTLGECDAQFRRKVAIITIAPDVVAQSSKRPIGEGIRKGREVEATVLHELFHVIEKPYYGQLNSELWPEGKQETRAWSLFQDYQEMMIETSCRILLEADAAGAWTA